MRVNDMHRTVLKYYANGDFEYLADSGTIYLFELEDILLTFILSKLSNEEGCENIETGIDRIAKGKDDLDVVLQALYALERTIESKQLDLQLERII